MISGMGDDEHAEYPFSVGVTAREYRPNGRALDRTAIWHGGLLDALKRLDPIIAWLKR